MIAVANKPIPVVPDTGTEKAARLATELTGNPGCWVRLDCGHPRHVQHMAPSVDGGLARRRVLTLSAAGRTRPRWS